jgi:hypothetical protein
LKEAKTPPAKTRPKKSHNYREKGTFNWTTFKKTANSRELALGLLWNNSGNPEKTPLLPRRKRLTAKTCFDAPDKKKRSQAHKNRMSQFGKKCYKKQNTSQVEKKTNTVVKPGFPHAPRKSIHFQKNMLHSLYEVVFY